MAPRKKTSTAKKKTTKKPTRKTTTKAKKTTSKVRKPKATKTTKKKAQKKQEPISFGLLQDEVDALLAEHHADLTDKNIEKNLAKELAAILPRAEKVTTKKTAKKHTNIVVNSKNNRDHSPFVLDLSDLVERKRIAEEKKQLVRNFFNNKAQKKIEIEEFEPTIKPVKKIVQKTEKTITIVTPRQERKENIREQFTAQPWYYNFNLPINWHRTIIVYLMICLMIVAPIKVFSYYSELQETKTEVMNYAQNAYEDLKIANQAIMNQELDTADQSFAKANQNFTQATEKIDLIDEELQAILKIIPNNGANLADAEYLLQIGETVTLLGNDLVKITEAFQSNENQNVTDKIVFLQKQIADVLPKLQDVQVNLNKIREQAIPEEKKQTFNTIKEYFEIILADLEELDRFSTAMNTILGKDSTQRYLFIFQNTNEIRPTGGFMGSLALADIDRGEIKNLEIPGGGIYHLQGQLLENKIAPYPMQLINSRWEMQDANWFPDFPTSAKKIRWFYEKSGGPTVDGVIALNVSIVPKLLEVLGPISMPEYGKVLTSDNFVEELQWAVEYEYDREENAPKQIISDMAPKLIEKIFSAKNDQLMAVMGIMKDSLDEKDIQMYFRNEAIQYKIASYNWSGEIKQSSRDYLAVIDTNIGGYKTDAYIDQNYDLASEIQPNGEIINTLKITRTHNGSSNSIFGNKSNIDYVRIYTPQGSQLISATGFSNITSTHFDPIEKHWEEDEDLLKIQGSVWIEPNSKTQVNNEFDKTVFGNWIQTDVGETSVVTIKYKLPFKLDFNEKKSLFEVFSKKENSSFHSLYLQKQSGKQNTTYQVSITLPKNKSLDWSYPSDLDVDNKNINLSTSLDEDTLISFVLE